MLLEPPCAPQPCAPHPPARTHAPPPPPPTQLGYRPFLLALLAEANADPKSPLFQRLNLNTTASAGHSRGGKLASLVLASDPLVKTAVLLDPGGAALFSRQAAWGDVLGHSAVEGGHASA